MQVDFDPERITYRHLLDIFWRSHNPARQAYAQQYKAAVFYHDERQQRLAEASRSALQDELGRTVHTEILPAQRFYRAEDYHQKYLLRQQTGLMAEFRAIYPDAVSFTDSTAAARINGWLGGYGSMEDLMANLDRLGLSSAGRQRLLALGRRLERGPAATERLTC